MNNRLKEHRTRFHISQADLSEMAGVSKQTIGLIERGENSPSVFTALRLAQALGVAVKDIFYFSKMDEI